MMTAGRSLYGICSAVKMILSVILKEFLELKVVPIEPIDPGRHNDLPDQRVVVCGHGVMPALLFALL